MRLFGGIFLAVLLVAGGVFFLGGGSRAAIPQLSREVVVAEGDTLWAIAVRADPESDPRRTIAEIMTLNRLRSVQLYPGQRVLIPIAP